MKYFFVNFRIMGIRKCVVSNRDLMLLNGKEKRGEMEIRKMVWGVEF